MPLFDFATDIDQLLEIMRKLNDTRFAVSGGLRPGLNKTFSDGPRNLQETWAQSSVGPSDHSDEALLFIRPHHVLAFATCFAGGLGGVLPDIAVLGRSDGCSILRILLSLRVPAE
jgi:hypothetical protein